MNIPGIWFPKIFEATREQPRITDLDVLHSCEQNVFKQNYAAKSIPFILKKSQSVFSQQKAIEILLSKVADHKLKVLFGDMSNPDKFINKQFVEMSLDKFVKSHFLNDNDSETAYAGSCIINDSFLEHLNIPYPLFYHQSFFNLPRLWMGKAGTVTQLHKDIPDNFAFNYFGKKKWIIYPPKDFLYLYMVNPHEEEFPDFGTSQIDLKQVDFKLFPDFKKAQKVEFILEAGDMLYLPAGWSHYVENLEHTLMINFWLLREKSPAILGLDK